MMSHELLFLIISALRDTADKVLEQATETRKQKNHYGYEEYVTFSVEKYSKDWVAGRLLGMADMLEAPYMSREKINVGPSE